MTIQANQHNPQFSKAVIAKYSDRRAPKLGLAAFFPKETTDSKYVSIEVERNRQPMAVDVERCTDPRLNKFSTFTEKIFLPPYYNEGVDVTSCERYDLVFGPNASPTVVNGNILANSIADKIQKLADMIARATEYQRAQVLQTGIVTLVNGDSINYKRKAESMVTLTNTDTWDQSTAKPLANIQTACNFLRNVGLSGGATVDMIMGGSAFEYLMANEAFVKSADIRRIERVNVNMPAFDEVNGMAFHGQIGVGEFTVNIWTYSDGYTNTSNTFVPYISPNNVIFLPRDFVGRTAYAGIPYIFKNEIGEKGIGVKGMEYYIHDVIDERRTVWEFLVKSAPLAIPVSIDRIYTLTVK